MTLTIQLPEELARRLRSEAEQAGTDETGFALRTLWERLSGEGPLYALTENEILARLQAQEFPNAFWIRYKELLPLSWTKTLTEEQREEFLHLNGQLEEVNTTRLRLLAELALRRGISLPEIMAQTGVKPLSPPEIILQ